MRHHGRNAHRRGSAGGPAHRRDPGGVRPGADQPGPARGQPDAEPDAGARRRPVRPRPRPSCGRPRPRSRRSSSYKVVSGDSLDKIAKKFKTSARSIAYWNRATYPSLDPEFGLLPAGLPEARLGARPHPERRGRPGEPADPAARRLRRGPGGRGRPDRRRPLSCGDEQPRLECPADRRDRRGRRAPERPGDRGAQERALRRERDATRRRGGRPRCHVRRGDTGRGLRLDGRPADQRRRRPPPGTLRPAEPRLDRRWSRTATRSNTRPGSRRRSAASPCWACAAASRRSTRSRAARSSSTSTATRDRAGGAAPAKIHPLRVAPGHATGPDPLPDQRRRRGPAVNSYHHQAVRAVGPGAGARRQRLGEQPGRRPDRGAGGGRRSFRVRGPVPPRAHRIDAAGLRAAVQRLRRRRAGAGRPALEPHGRGEPRGATRAGGGPGEDERIAGRQSRPRLSLGGLPRHGLPSGEPADAARLSWTSFDVSAEVAGPRVDILASSSTG